MADTKGNSRLPSGTAEAFAHALTSMSDEEFSRCQALTPAEIAELLRKGEEDRRKVEEAGASCEIPSIVIRS